MSKKEVLNLCFRDLRKLGYTAKQNWKCCQSCGWSAISYKQARKAVFYHGQDKWNLEHDGYCYLCWAGKGAEIVKVFTDRGIKVEWDGSKNTRIKLYL